MCLCFRDGNCCFSRDLFSLFFLVKRSSLAGGGGRRKRSVSQHAKVSHKRRKHFLILSSRFFNIESQVMAPPSSPSNAPFFPAQEKKSFSSFLARLGIGKSEEGRKADSRNPPPQNVTKWIVIINSLPSISTIFYSGNRIAQLTSGALDFFFCIPVFATGIFLCPPGVGGWVRGWWCSNLGREGTQPTLLACI